MKQNNFFTSLSPLARTTLIICLIALPILIISTVFIVLTMANNKDNNSNNLALNITNTITPSFTYSPNTTVPAVTHTVSPTTDPYAGWKDYYFAQYDISFKYPADWVVTIDSKDDQPGGTDKIECSESFSKILNDYTKCIGQIIKAFRININPNTKAVVEGLTFSIGANNGSNLENNSKIEVNSKIYNSYVNDGLMYVNEIPAGPKSIFAKFNIIGMNNANDKNLMYENLIIKSIKF